MLLQYVSNDASHFPLLAQESTRYASEKSTVLSSCASIKNFLTQDRPERIFTHRQVYSSLALDDYASQHFLWQ